MTATERGSLRVYVGVAAGAGATCALLAEARRRAERGRHVQVGPVETHGRAGTIERLDDLRRAVGDPAAGAAGAFDLAAALAARPDVVVLDDLAHPYPGAPGAGPRWLDAEALLDAGIDVVGTVRVDEIESLSDLSAQVTGRQGPTVPDAMLKSADQLELVDITPEALRRRLAHGALHGHDELDPAATATFQPARLARLRELALEWMADRAEDEANRYRQHPAVAAAPDEDTPTVAVALTGRPGNERAVRRAARLADRLGARVVGLSRHGRDGVTEPGDAVGAEERLVVHLGGDVRAVVGGPSAAALVEAARAAQAGQLLVGSDADVGDVVREAALAHLDVHVVPVGVGGPAHRSWPLPLGAVVAVGAVAAAAVVATALHVPDAWAFALALAAAVVAAGALAWGVRSGRTARRLHAEADELAGTARTLVSSTDPLAAMLERVRTSLRLDGVAVVAPSGRGPVVEASVGAAVPVGRPDAAADVDRSGRVLAVTGRRLGPGELRLLRGYAAQVAAARQHRRLHDDAGRAAVVAEGDALRTAILRAVSHDLHTPLASIKASVSGLLQADVAFSADDRHELLVTIETEADRLHRMVTNLLDVSRLQAGALQVDLRPAYLEDVVAAALANIAHRPERVRVDVPETVPPVLVDPALLERALANLLANALAWTPADRPVRVDAGPVGAEVHVRVVDRGPGIPTAERNRVLQPFQRIGQRSLQAGAGLGLTVVSGFVDAIGGRLALDDTPGGGLTATVSLRAAPAEPPPPEPAMLEPAPPASHEEPA